MRPTFDLLLSGGTVVTGTGIRRADVAVQGEQVAAVEAVISPDTATEVVNISGKYLLPGIIDVHVHPVYVDSVADCSILGAYAGTTTVLHFAYARPGDSLLQKVEEMLADALANSRVDFGLHGGMFEAARQVPEIPQVMALGVRTFKFFLTYLKQGWYTDDYQLIKAMDMLAERGGMAMVHAENGGAIDYLEDKYLRGSDAAGFFNISRPAALEEEAIFRAIRLAEVVSCPLYIAHVTSARGVDLIRREQMAGARVYAETCPQYLTLTEEIIQEFGALAKIGPPIRTVEDRDALWTGLRDGTLSIVSSDHAAKLKDRDGDFLEQGFGSPQMETLLPLVHDGGVNLGRIGLVRMVQVLSENPARVFGLYPQKGTIAVGSDADLVVLDPNREFTIRAENQHSGVGYTLYEGRRVLGWPEMSFQRGRPLLREGTVVAQPGNASFLPTLESPLEPGNS